MEGMHNYPGKGGRMPSKGYSSGTSFNKSTASGRGKNPMVPRLEKHSVGGSKGWWTAKVAKGKG